MLPLPRKGDDAMKYVCKRILMLLVTMVIVSLLAFAAFELIHGSAAEIMLGTQATPERVAELEAGPPLRGAVSGVAGGLFHRGPGDFLQL